MSRRVLEKSGYLKSFPHLLGCVSCLQGSEAQIRTVVDDFDAGRRDLCLALRVGESHDGVAVRHIQGISHERHSERRVEPGQEHRTRLGDANYDNPEFVRAISAFTPMARVADAGEIKGAALYLASPASSFTTGLMLVTDGGCMAK